MFNRKRSLSPIQNVRKIIVPNIFNKNYKTNSNSPQKDKLYSDFNNLMEKKY